MIKKLSISGFRNFTDDPISELDLISNGFILIGGSNGSGKSTIFYALQFVFGAKKGRFEHKKIRRLINKNENINFTKVSVTLDNSNNDIPFLNENVTIERNLGKINSEYDSFKLNGEEKNLGEIRDFLKTIHIDPDNPFQFAEQGKLTSILIKSPSERFKLLDILIP